MEENSEAGIFKDIFLDIGDEQSLENDLSTYSSHLLNIREFITHGNRNTLFLIDEFGTGTEPHLGGAIAEASLHAMNKLKAFGVVTISFTAKPLEHFIKIYGTKAVIKVNVDTMTTTIHKLSRLPKAAQKATFNLSESWQLFKSTVANVWNFGRGRLRPYHGMKTLIHRFYDAVDGKGVIPVSREEALNVIETMDKLWSHIQNKHLKFDPVTVDDSSPDLKVRPRVLVTGATGFLGSRLVEVLVQKGYRVRALARKLSHIEKLKNLQTEIFFGDVGDADSLKPAFKDVDVVVHAAADTAGTEEGGQLSTLLGTSNILDLCKEYKVKKLVYISSCSVYGVADYKKNGVVTETSSLEHFPEKRGHYSNAKMKAEQLVADAMKKDELPVVCLRPGTIFGPGGEIYTPMMGFSLGTRMFIIIGNGEFRLPLVYIDNLIEAIVAAIEKDQSGSQIYNVVDPDNVTKKEYVELLLKKLDPAARYFYFPYSMLYATVFFQEILTRLLRRPPFLTCYRLTSSQKNIRYDSSKIQKDLVWGPSCSTKDAFEKIIQFEKGKRV
jgi:nucleoside-diphosphate-sugar epimerase